MAGMERHPAGAEVDKQGETSEPGHQQPEAAEVESARLLANQAREDLDRAGLADEEIRRAADEYVVERRGGDLADFISWAISRKGRSEPG